MCCYCTKSAGLLYYRYLDASAWNVVFIFKIYNYINCRMNVGNWEAGKSLVGTIEVAGALLTVELLFKIGT